jgi:hypothetical protein
MIKKSLVKFSNPLFLIKEGNCFSPLGERLPYAPLGEKGTKLPWGAISLGEQVLKCLIRKYRGSNLSKSIFLIPLENH